MNIQITKINELKEKLSTGFLLDNFEEAPYLSLTDDELNYLKKKAGNEDEEAVVNKYSHLLFFHALGEEKNGLPISEIARQAGAKLFNSLKKEKVGTVQLANFSDASLTFSFIEGLLLASYSFSKYKSEKEGFSLKEIFVFDDHITEKELSELVYLVEAVFIGRDLVNEPLSTLNAVTLAEEIGRLGNDAGFNVDIFNLQKIQSLKMGGLLAVNKGSIDPPTFSIMEWKPEDAANEKPVVLVGKGIVYDTGGLSLKPTPNSMDYMKSDMGGAAAVIGTLYALARCKKPLHVIGLVPATDNRPDGNAYVPGDIITMYDGTTVEIKNTDAEGRLILADALSYAKKYNPSLVIDLATLTGSASILTGAAGSAIMGNSNKNIGSLKESGHQVHERLVELPLWDDFKKPLKSPVADLNNLGVREGQTMIAGKFLEHFTDYPWIHLDIAGTAFIFEQDGYHPKGGTGTGIRLLFNFLNKFK